MPNASGSSAGHRARPVVLATHEVRMHIVRNSLTAIAVAATTAIASIGTATPLLAQDSSRCACPARIHTPSDFELRSSGVFSFAQSRPIGAFARNVGFGYGGTAAYLYRLDRSGIFSLRLDAGLLGYGEESKRVPLSPTIGGRIQVRVTTTNYLLPLGIGPQLTWPSGPVRPYANAGVGGQLFFTESSVDGDDGRYDFANTTNQSDWTGAWLAGAGVYIPLHEGRTKVMLDLGVQYFTSSHAQYLRPGSIQDLPDSQIQITRLESDTHMALVRVGVKIGL
jgi:opacity protein-like surface antigen